MGLLVRARAVWIRYASSVGTILLRTGGFLLLLAIAFAGYSWNWARHRVKTDATVVENIAAFAPHGGVVYTPRVRFRAEDDSVVQLIVGPGSSDADFAPGDIVPVLYPTGEVQQTVIATKWRLYFWAIWFAIAGTVLFDAGLVVKRLKSTP